MYDILRVHVRFIAYKFAFMRFVTMMLNCSKVRHPPRHHAQTSVMTLVGAFICERSVALARASLAAVKAFKEVSVHISSIFPSHCSGQQIV